MKRKSKELAIDLDSVESMRDLEESLSELRRVPQEAKQDGLREPSQIAMGNAEQTIKRLTKYYQARYSSSSNENGDVVISVPTNSFGSALSIECDSDGGLTCFVNYGERVRRMKDYDANQAWESSDFIVRALSEIVE